MDIHSKRLFLLDLDGTLYLDEQLFPGTIPFLSAVRKKGGRYIFLTNNSSKGVGDYIAKMKRLGIDACKDDFLTSVDVTVRYLLEREAGKLFYVLGTESFRSQLAAAGVSVTTDRETPGIGGLVMGYDTELTYRKLEDACILLGRGVTYIATHPDMVCPSWYGFAPDCGSVAVLLESATGRTPRFLGKPEPDMLLLALSRTGIPADEAVMIGDRLNTDIASGVNAGIDTVLVLTGEGTVEEAAQFDKKPTLILPDIGEVCRAIL